MILSVCPNPSIDAYAWLQTFENGRANRITKMSEFPGGKGIHVAMALRELGARVSLIANWAGTNGEWIKNTPQLSTMDKLGTQLEGNNRKCYTFRSSNNKAFDNSELLEPGPEMTIEDWNKFVMEFQLAVKVCSLICLSGSWPKGAPEDAYGQLLKICDEEGKKAILDCSGIQLDNALENGFFGLHINEHEANSAFGTQNSLEIRNHLKNKVSLIAITKGKEGLFLHSTDRSVHANVSIENVKSTVGSGDCLTAGIAYAVDKGSTLEDIAKYGVACGAANCLNEDLGMLRLQDVNNLLPKVQLESLLL